MNDTKNSGFCVICHAEIGHQPDDNEKRIINGDEPLCWRCFKDAVQRQGWIVMATLSKRCMGVENPK
jgi:hypothetical protein